MRFARLSPHDTIPCSCYADKMPLDEDITSPERLPVSRSPRCKSHAAKLCSVPWQGPFCPRTHSDSPSCACFYDACCDVHLNSKCFSRLSFFVSPFCLFLSGCSCNSTLCLRLDMSQSVILKQKKTFTRYKILASSFAPSTSKC